MHIIITYPSSATFWLNVSGRKIIDRDAIEANLLRGPLSVPPASPRGSLSARIARKMGLGLPLDIFVDIASHKNNHDASRCHLWPGVVPRGSFVHIGEIGEHEIYVASPEFTFLQAAKFLPEIDLALLGTELCAIYAYDFTSQHHQRAREAITSAERIRSLLDAADGAYGIQKARRAAGYIIDNSNSPMESRLALFASMPRRLGGMQLPKPRLNEVIRLSGEARELYGYETIRGDMLWERVVFDYDSDECHTSSEGHAKDIDRQNALSEQGYTVVRASAGTVRDPEKCAAVFDCVRRKLGMHVGVCSARLAQRRSRLLNTLLHSRVEEVVKSDAYTIAANEAKAAVEQ